MSEIKKGSRVLVVSVDNTDDAGYGVRTEMARMLDKEYVVSDVGDYTMSRPFAMVEGWTFHTDDLELVVEE